MHRAWRLGAHLAPVESLVCCLVRWR